MRLKSVVLVLVVSALSAFAAGAAPDNYKSMVEHVIQGDHTVNFRDLRLAADASKGYRKRPDSSSLSKRIGTELTGKDYAKAAKDAEALLATDFVNIEAHYSAFLSYHALGNTEKAEFHKFVFTGLLQSILQDGDGKTPETAHTVITVDEEYVVLHSLGVGLPKSQSLLHQGGHSYDKLVYVDPDSNQEKTVFFNIDIVWARETELFK